MSRNAGSASGAVLERFMETTPDEFSSKFNDLTIALNKITQAVVEQVEEERISPVQGLGIVGCVAAQAYGWQAFHGQATFADLWTQYSPTQ